MKRVKNTGAGAGSGVGSGVGSDVGQMFSAIAPTYDPLNHLLSLGIDRVWRRKVVAEISQESEVRSQESANAGGKLDDETIRRLDNEAIRQLDDGLTRRRSCATPELRGVNVGSPQPPEGGADGLQTQAGKPAALPLQRLITHDSLLMTPTLSPQILDVATGTGDLAIALARRLPEARIVGVDISEGMLAIGRRKVEKFLRIPNPSQTSAPPAPLQGAQNEFQRNSAEDRIVLQSGDAQNLPFADGTFDAVTVAFGVRNFEDKALGLSEMRRVLKSGGRCVVLEFSEPRGALFGPLYRFYFHRVLPLVGRLVSRSAGAYTYLPRSVDVFPPPEKFVEMVLKAGFSEVRTRKMTFGIVYVYVIDN